MAYAASLRGWGPGWPSNRAKDMATVRTKHGQTVQVNHVIAPLVQFLFNEVERRGYLIHKPGQIKDDWGYSNRPIRGRSTPSNHSWGLAVDIDATRYPMGTRRNPPSWIVDLFEKYGFEWGGRWSRPDPMHFEFRGSITEARHMVAMLAAGHLVNKPAPMPDTAPDPEPEPPEDDMPPPIVITHHDRNGVWLHFRNGWRTQLNTTKTHEENAARIAYWKDTYGDYLDLSKSPVMSQRWLDASEDIRAVRVTALAVSFVRNAVGSLARKAGVTLKEDGTS